MINISDNSMPGNVSDKGRERAGHKGGVRHKVPAHVCPGDGN